MLTNNPHSLKVSLQDNLFINFLKGRALHEQITIKRQKKKRGRNRQAVFLDMDDYQ